MLVLLTTDNNSVPTMVSTVETSMVMLAMILLMVVTVLPELGVLNLTLVPGMALTTVLMATLPDKATDSALLITLLSETMASDIPVPMAITNLLFLWVTTDMELTVPGVLLPTLVLGPEILLEPTVPP